MDFKETYRHEVYLSRKDRSRRALFAAKVVGIILALTMGATLRASPELRSALMTAGMDGVAHVASLEGGSTVSDASARAQTPQYPIKTTFKPMRTENPAGQAPLTPDVKVNRFGQVSTVGGVNLQNDARAINGLLTQQP